MSGEPAVEVGECGRSGGHLTHSPALSVSGPPPVAIRVSIRPRLTPVTNRYDAMFTLGVELPFGDPGELTPLSDAFAELRAVAEPLAGGQDVELFTEVVWSSLHGLVTLTQNDRLRPNLSPARLQLLVDRLLT